MPITKTKEKPKKWEIKQDDYVELLRAIEKNAQTILTLVNDMKRIKTRLGL